MGHSFFQFGKYYDLIMHRIEQRVLKDRRRQLLGNVEGTVIEIGAGTGSNVPFYPRRTKVLAIEPSKGMVSQAQAKYGQSYQNIKWINTSVEAFNLLDYHGEKQVDAIVATLVWCTLPNPTATVEQIKEWLKPGGKVFLIEHICPKTQPGRGFVHFVQPLWGVISGHCHLNRDTDLLFKKAGFVPIQEGYFSIGLPFYEGILQLK